MAKPKGGLTKWFKKEKSMSKSQIKSAVTRKRAKAQGVGGKPTNVKTFVKRKKTSKIKRA